MGGVQQQRFTPSHHDRFDRLTFVPAKYAKRRPSDHLKSSNIVLLNGEDEEVQGGAMHSPSSSQPMKKHAGKHQGGGEIFSEDDIMMKWTQIRRVGSGLCNLGNTCFMNSVLQCLVHTPPLAELLLSGRRLSAKASSSGDLDPIGITQRLVQDSLNGKKEYISPTQHAKSLKRIHRGFRLGRQEDAHEYLIALLDAMHEQSIAGIKPKPSRDLEYTSFIYRIFGGRIRSQVKCTDCDYESNTYDPFLDLSLEISRAHSVQKALQRFTAGEVLDGGNSYKCPKQKKMVRAVKRMTIEDAPKVLIIQLKRFEFSRSGRKISKPVDFDPTLDLSPFLSHRPKQSALYDLYGILVHQGYSMHSGHYYCFLKGATGGEWHKFDDTRVCATSARNALGQSPYILFYIKRTSPRPKPFGKENLETPISREMSTEMKKSIEKSSEKRKREEDCDGALDISKKHPDNPNKRNDTCGIHHDMRKKMKANSDRNSSHEKNSMKQRSISSPAVALPEKPHSSDKRKQARSASLEGSNGPRDARSQRVQGHVPIQDNIDEKHAKSQNKTMFMSAPRPRRAMMSPLRSPLTGVRIAGVSIDPRSQFLSGVRLRSGKRLMSDVTREGRKVTGASKGTKDSTTLPGKLPLSPPISNSNNAAANRSIEKRGKDVLNLLMPNSKDEVRMGLNTWDDVDEGLKKARDANIAHTILPRKEIDEYDAEYDKGKTKKVRDKSKARTSLTASAFDAVSQTLKKGVQKVFGTRQQQPSRRRTRTTK